MEHFYFLFNQKFPLSSQNEEQIQINDNKKRESILK